MHTLNVVSRSTRRPFTLGLGLVVILCLGLSATRADAGDACPPTPPKDVDKSPTLAFLISSKACALGTNTTQPPALATAASMTPDDTRMLILAMGLKKAAGRLYEDSRVDEQQGSSSNTSGTTSAVSSAAVPAFLSMAVENGAIASSQSGNTVSLRANVPGIFRVIDKHGLLEIAGGRRDKWFEGLSNLTLTTSFDTSRGDTSSAQDAPPAGTATASPKGDLQQLSAWSLRGELVNTHAAHLQELWHLLSTQAQASLIGGDMGALTKSLAPDAGNPSPAKSDSRYTASLQKWIDGTNRELLEASTAHRADATLTMTCPSNPYCSVLESRLRDIPLPGTDEQTDGGEPDALSPTVKRVAARLTPALTPQLLATAVAGVIVTTELTNDRGVSGTTLSTGRVIAAINTGKVTLTANAGLAFPHGGAHTLSLSKPQAAEFAGQLDVPFGAATGLGRFVFSVNFKLVHMLDDPIDLATGSRHPSLRSNIALSQIRLIIPTNGSGLKIPLSVTVANRSELIKEKVVRANVGVTYDLDSLLARFR